MLNLEEKNKEEVLHSHINEFISSLSLRSQLHPQVSLRLVCNIVHLYQLEIDSKEQASGKIMMLIELGFS